MSPFRSVTPGCYWSELPSHPARPVLRRVRQFFGRAGFGKSRLKIIITITRRPVTSLGGSSRRLLPARQAGTFSFHYRGISCIYEFIDVSRPPHHGGCRRVPVPLQVASAEPGSREAAGARDAGLSGATLGAEKPGLRQSPTCWPGCMGWDLGGSQSPPPPAAGVEQFDRAPSQQVKERRSTHLSTSFSTCSISHIANSEHTMRLLNKIMLFLVLVCMWFLRLCLETNL